MNLNTTLITFFIQSSIVLRNLIDRKLAETNLHSGQIFVLISLWESDGLSQNELAKRLKVSPPTINKMVKSLLKSQYVSCQNCQNDGRIVRVFLTKKGVDVRPVIENIWIEIEDVYQSNLTEPEKMILLQLIEKSFNNLVS